MVSRAELFRSCVSDLELYGADSAQFDTLCIFQDMLGDKNPLFKPAEPVPPDIEARIRDLVHARTQGQPLQYLLGKWEFFGYPFFVGSGVLIPRPDTEILIEQVLDICKAQYSGAPRIADLCSGSGCIAVTLKNLLPHADVCAVEISDTAIGFIQKNAQLNHADIRIVKGDVLSVQTADVLGSFDIIVSNPPYLSQQDMDSLQAEVRCEPSLALFGGQDGLDFYRAMTPLWKNHLNPNGWLCYEYGLGQHDDVKSILAGNGFQNITLRRDLAGIIRTAAAQITEVI